MSKAMQSAAGQLATRLRESSKREADLDAARDAIVDAALKCHEANGCTGVGNIDRAVAAYRKLLDAK
jgi:hypothetical protein